VLLQRLYVLFVLEVASRELWSKPVDEPLA
jgi:hypothetical protein